MRTANNSEYSDSSRNSHVSNNYSKEPENDKSNQQPSVIRGSFTQIMVNPMQLQDHEFIAWLDRLVEARKNRQEKRQQPYRNFRKPYNEGRQKWGHRIKTTSTEIELSQPKSWKYNKLWTILTVNMTM